MDRDEQSNQVRIMVIRQETNDQNREQVSPKIEESSKEIENKVEINTLLSEKKCNREKEKMMHIEINIKGVKKQIIKKTKERRIIHPKKLRNTQEGLDMIRSGLINVFNLTIVNYLSLIHI